MGDTTTELKGEVILTAEVIAQFSETEKTIVKIEEELGSLVITDPDDKEQYDKVHNGRMDLVKVRTQGIDPLEKQLKAPAIAFNNAVGDMAEGLRSRVKRVEAHLKSQEDIVDAKREEARKEKERKNAEKLQERVNQMTVVGGNVDLVWLRGLTDAQFAEAFIVAEKAYDEKKKQEEIDKQKAEDEKKAQIEAQKKIDLDRENLEKEKAELFKQRKSVRDVFIRSLGFVFDETQGHYKKDLTDGSDYFVSLSGILEMTDEKFNEYCAHLSEIIEGAKKQKEAQDIIDQSKEKEEINTRTNYRIEKMNGLGLVFNPQENSFVEAVPTELCINFHITDIKCMTSEDFEKTVLRVQELQDKQKKENAERPDREKLLAYVEQLKAIRIPEVNNEGAYAKFPAQIKNTLDHMETLIKTA